MHVWIEPTSRCNSRCIHCGHYYSVFGQDMTGEVYEKVKTVLTSGIQRVSLIGYGEPFISHLFWQIFKDCSERDIEIFITSNGLALTDEAWVSKLVRHRVVLSLSVDGIRPETYEFVRPFIKWTRIKAVLETIKRCSDEAGPEKRFRLAFNFVAMKKNIEDLPDLVRLAQSYGATEIMVLPLGAYDIHPLIKDQSLRDIPEIEQRFFSEARQIAETAGIRLILPSAFSPEKHDVIKQVREIGLKRLRHMTIRAFNLLRAGDMARIVWAVRRRLKRQPTDDLPFPFQYCKFPWDDSYIAADGTVSPCCILGLTLGNVLQKNWDEIWNGRPYQNLRRTIHGWNPTALCRTCPLPSGINGGDGGRYRRYFELYNTKPVPIGSKGVQFSPECFSDGSEPGSRRYFIPAQASLSLPRLQGAAFLRLRIEPLAPAGEINPGICRINSGDPEFFDNSCETVTFPLRRVRGNRLNVDLAMENSYKTADGRVASLVLCEVEYLYNTSCVKGAKQSKGRS
jgi:MoaA/NifB/PqqE/SkfB family radical SAM enzyme